MRNIFHDALVHLTLVTQVASPIAGLVSAAPQTASAHAETVPYEINIDTTTAGAVVVKQAAQPDFDIDVVAPLRAAQAAKAAAEAAEAARVAAAQKAAARAAVRTAPAVTVSVDVAEGLRRIRMCESGGVYTRNSGNGYFGAYQYNLGTWGGYGGYARPDLAPAEVQDAKAAADVAARGYRPWASCARMNGLL